MVEAIQVMKPEFATEHFHSARSDMLHRDFANKWAWIFIACVISYPLLVFCRDNLERGKGFACSDSYEYIEHNGEEHNHKHDNT